MFYLTTHSTHNIPKYLVSSIKDTVLRQKYLVLRFTKNSMLDNQQWKEENVLLNDVLNTFLFTVM